MKTFKTAKGTELPILDIKGKDYLQAAPRIFWMKEEHPDWSIETSFLLLSDAVAVCQATIRDGNGKVLAQASSMETPAGFEAYVEKAETCAVSRAASFCGYGTLMAQELEEHGKLAESPQAPKRTESPVAATYVQKPSLALAGDGITTPAPLKAVSPSGHICPFGKNKGMTFEQVGRPALAKDRDYWVGRSKIEKVSKGVQDYIDAINQYL